MDPALKFVVDIQNSEKVQQLTHLIGQQTEQIYKLNTALKQGAISEAAFNAQAVPLAQNAVAAAREIKSIEAASGGAGRGLSQLAYAIDDVQYGFNAIVNNIPMIVMGLGGSAGIAGAVGIAAVAVNQLIKHWGELTDALQSAWSGAAVDQLTAMREKAEAASKAFEELAKAPTKAQAAEAAGASSLITEGPTETRLQQVIDALKRSPTGPQMTADEKARIEMSDPSKHLRGPDHYPNTEQKYFDVQQQVERAVAERLKATAKDLLGQATLPGDKGKFGRQALGQLVPELQLDLENLTPEGQKAVDQKRLDLAGGRNARIAEQKLEEEERQRQLDQKRLDLAGGRQGRKQEEAAADKDRRLVDNLNQAGMDNQRAGENQARADRIQDIEDQKKLLQETHHQQDLRLQEQREALGHPTQIMSGAKAVVDYYQKAAGDAPLVALAKATKQIQEDQRTQLIELNKKIDKLRGTRPS